MSHQNGSSGVNAWSNQPTPSSSMAWSNHSGPSNPSLPQSGSAFICTADSSNPPAAQNNSLAAPNFPQPVGHQPQAFNASSYMGGGIPPLVEGLETSSNPGVTFHGYPMLTLDSSKIHPAAEPYYGRSLQMVQPQLSNDAYSLKGQYQSTQQPQQHMVMVVAQGGLLQPGSAGLNAVESSDNKEAFGPLMMLADMTNGSKSGSQVKQTTASATTRQHPVQGGNLSNGAPPQAQIQQKDDSERPVKVARLDV